MLDKIYSSQLTDLQNALSRTTQRQALLTSNLANVNVPGYKRQDIDFHVALQNQVGGPTQTQLDQKDAQAQTASDAVSLRQDGNNVDMETEITGISETDLHYETLTSLATQYFSGLKSVIREGK
jgi:flagellar basal-body rod protein FlgB